jgi:hypothetical protein
MTNLAAGSTAADRSKLVVVELSEVHAEAQVSGLRTGQGALVNRIQRIVDDLVEAGTLKAGAQTVVLVVRESAPFLFSTLASDEEEDPYA